MTMKAGPQERMNKEVINNNAFELWAGENWECHGSQMIQC